MKKKPKMNVDMDKRTQTSPGQTKTNTQADKQDFARPKLLNGFKKRFMGMETLKHNRANFVDFQLNGNLKPKEKKHRLR